VVINIAETGPVWS